MTERGLVKELEGVVISNKMQKTVIVQIEAHVKHPKYGKYYIQKSKFAAHDESSAAGLGDLVSIKQTRPLSKTKRWKVTKVLRKAPEEIILAPVVLKPAKASAATEKTAKTARVSKKKGSAA